MDLIIILQQVLVKIVVREETLIKEKNKQIREKTAIRDCVKARKFLRKTTCITIDIKSQLISNTIEQIFELLIKMDSSKYSRELIK
jgi:hypothetical protein